MPEPRTQLECRAAEEMLWQTTASAWEIATRTPFVCREWCNRCWHRWLRIRALEHLRGEHRWEELDHGDFGVLRRPFHPNTALVQRILGLLSTGDENLVVINCLVAERWSLNAVATILARIDLNGRRLQRFPFLPRIRRPRGSARPSSACGAPSP